MGLAAGAVMRNGPAFDTTVNCMSAVLTPPPAERPSRAVTRKFSVRLNTGNCSPTEGVPVPCRPDFVLWPQGDQPGALPAAIFTDGFAYHVKPEQPQGALPDDIRKRLKAREVPKKGFCWHCRKPLHARADTCPFCGETQ